MSYEDGKVLVEGRDGFRYVWPPEPPFEMIVPSVSTILANQSAPRLEKWKLSNAARWAVDQIPEWENLPPDEAANLIVKAADSDYSAADFGTAVHDAIEATLNDETPEIEDLDALPYVAAATQFIAEHVDRIGVSEETFYSERHQYAGTPDALVKLKDGRFAIVDWKTGSRIYATHALQVAAYARADFIGKKDGTRINLDREIAVGVVVHLRPTATYTAYFCDITDELFETFRSLRTIQTWRDELESDIWFRKETGQATAERKGDN